MKEWETPFLGAFAHFINRRGQQITHKVILEYVRCCTEEAGMKMYS